MTGSSHQIDHLTSHDVAAYVRSSGWKHIGNYGQEASAFEKNEHQLLIPLATDFADYGRRMAEVVSSLAKFEARSLDAVLRDLAYASADVFRIRLQNPLFEGGEVTLDQGILLFDNAQKLVHAAARSAINPKAYHLARAGTQAEDFLKRVKLGQTEIGSYILTIVFPITPDLLDDQDEEASLPFERKVTRGIVSGLNSLETALRSQVAKPSLEPFLKLVKKGVSANLCEAISNIGEKTEGTMIDTQLTWARNRRAPEMNTKARFQAGDFSYLRSAAENLKEQAWDEELVVTGPVTRIESDAALFGGDVFVNALIGESVRRVKLNLDQDQYQQANQAHLAGQAIEVRGKIEKQGRYLTMVSPAEFSVFEIKEEDQ
ncbi:hypothetical protein [Roseibacillus persicicus]|uniref:Uncharacterized protein n=1 Tax=Roseibacillus persicicus TaxID=454148 RepID=A0A918WG52_9BACT|nr:hypothetical protein [Roseibacillus persicicus]GHC44396.1 hypothetical protein GCM10007100_07100 [Roseibacillus persicicus]